MNQQSENKQKSSILSFSNIISTLSFLLAVAALFITTMPKKAKIDIESLPYYNHVASNDTNSLSNTVIRLLIRNNGEKPVTIERLLKKDTNKWLMGFSNSGKSFPLHRGSMLKLIKQDLFSKYYLARENDSLRYFDYYEGLILNKTIEPGENMQLNFLISLSNLFYNDIKTVSFDATLSLSDKREVPLYFEYDIH